MDNPQAVPAEPVEALPLICHPATLGRAVDTLTVQIEMIGPDSLALEFQLRGQIAALKIPPMHVGRPTDELWKHTCFEMFSRCTDHSDAYEELNLSPSGDWACYDFAAYRRGMSPIRALPPQITVVRESDVLRLYARAALAEGRGPWHIALSAVIEELDGTKSYWALRHPPGPPDFHHPDCFALTLPAPD